MAAIPATPLFMKNVLLTLTAAGGGSAAEYQCHVSEARVAVTPGDRVDIATLCAAGQFSEVGRPSYALALTGVQDWHDATGVLGLSRFLWDHEGEVADFVLQAHGTATTIAAATPAMTGKVRIIPGDYGGTINEYAELSVELPCTEKPVLDDGAGLLLAAQDAEPAIAAAYAAD